MMIFVTVGTHEQPFNRLVQEIDNLKNKDKIDELELFIKEKYYLHKNLDLYISYYSAHKENSIKELQYEIKEIESIKAQADNFVTNLKNILA